MFGNTALSIPSQIMKKDPSNVFILQKVKKEAVHKNSSVYIFVSKLKLVLYKLRNTWRLIFPVNHSANIQNHRFWELPHIWVSGSIHTDPWWYVINEKHPHIMMLSSPCFTVSSLLQLGLSVWVQGLTNCLVPGPKQNSLPFISPLNISPFLWRPVSSSPQYVIISTMGVSCWETPTVTVPVLTDNFRSLIPWSWSLQIWK